VIVGQGVVLRGWRESDLDVLCELRNDVELQSQLIARARGSDLTKVRQWLRVRGADEHGLLLVIADRDDDRALGYLQLQGITGIDRRAELGICLHRTAQGRGVGTESLRLLEPYLRDIWAIRKIFLQVRAENVRAISCYERVGFERCGLLREHVFADGAYRDVVLMERFVAPGIPHCAS
jgi:RimJ/RimL family protein N-acetyltransferase